ncbi:MAG: HAD family hydrolase [Gammaproteobacteria bacterium]
MQHETKMPLLAKTISSEKITAKVTPNELIPALNQYAKQIKVLSLDCFDTIIWRRTSEPADVFYDMQQRPVFQERGFSAIMRTRGEQLAYQVNSIKSLSNQATLKQIYQTCFPNENDEQIKLFMEEEMAAEIEALFSYPPVIELIRAAHAENIKIIIVSDTYFEESQLRTLLKCKLPADVMAMISQIFCSCEHGKSKTFGLFKNVIDKLHLPAHSILHIGDNVIADFEAPQKFNINAFHLTHQTDELAEIHRMQDVAVSFLDSTLRSTRALCKPFRGLFSTDMHNVTPEKLLGYVSMGPIMHAFARFIVAEYTSLQCANKRPKLLFLMRDAWLPFLATETLMHKSIGTCTYLSRFSAYAASFRQESDVTRYLSSNLDSLRFKEMCSQLLLPEDTTRLILKKLENSISPALDFRRMIYQKHILDVIFNQSKAYFLRLKKYLEKEVDLSAEDTLLFVDLGYTGTAEVLLAPIFKNELNVNVTGCYLIGLRTPETPDWKNTRNSLFSPTHYDDKALSLLVTHIAVIEQLCTSNESSVVDYDENGSPIFTGINLTEEQHKKLDLIQNECLRFVRDAEKYLDATHMHINREILRDNAASNLARLIFFLTKPELNYLAEFNHEVNLGTEDILPLIDVKKGVDNLHRRGWLYSLKENNKNKRMNYPAELRSHSIELVINLMAQHRFDYKLSLRDISHTIEKLSCVALVGDQLLQFNAEAYATYDGYFSALVPVVTQATEIGVQFGRNYQWVEIESTTLIAISHLNKEGEIDHTQDVSQNMTVNRMSYKNNGFFECEHESAMLVFVPSAEHKDTNRILRIVYRPTF